MGRLWVLADVTDPMDEKLASLNVFSSTWAVGCDVEGLWMLSVIPLDEMIVVGLIALV